MNITRFCFLMDGIPVELPATELQITGRATDGSRQTDRLQAIDAAAFELWHNGETQGRKHNDAGTIEGILDTYESYRITARLGDEETTLYTHHTH